MIYAQAHEMWLHTYCIWPDRPNSYNSTFESKHDFFCGMLKSDGIVNDEIATTFRKQCR